MILNVNTGPSAWPGGCFVPHRGARRAYVGIDLGRRNPWELQDAPLYSGLIILGLEGRTKRTKIDRRKVVEYVREIRTAQAKKFVPRFILQRGLYRSQKGDDVEEESVRIIILHLTKEPREKFKVNILRLTESMAARFGKDELFVEFQLGGVARESYRVWPPEKKSRGRGRKAR